MKSFLIRNGSLILGLLLGSLLMLLCLPLLENERGAAVASMLQAQSPAMAMIVLLLCLAAVTAIAIVVTRLVNACVGFFVLGGSVYALDYRLATVNEILLGGSLSTMVIELFLWTIIALGISLAMFKLGGPLRDVHEDEDGRTPSPLFSAEAIKSAAAGIIILPAVWFLTVSELKGQAFGSVFVGALAAGLAARLLSPHVQPILLFASPLLFAAIASIVALKMAGGSVDEMYRLHALPPLLRVAPIDYLCGTFMGVAVGFGWARSFLHHEEDDHAHHSAGATAR